VRDPPSPAVGAGNPRVRDDRPWLEPPVADAAGRYLGIAGGELLSRRSGVGVVLEH
jgi:hypothetical protein